MRNFQSSCKMLFKQIKSTSFKQK